MSAEEGGTEEQLERLGAGRPRQDTSMERRDAGQEEVEENKEKIRTNNRME